MTEMGAQGRKRTERERRLIGERGDGKLVARGVLGVIVILGGLPIFLIFTVAASSKELIPAAILSGVPLVAGVLLVQSSLRAERRSRSSSSH